MSSTDGDDVISCSSADEWDAWLAEQHSTSSGVWLKMAKKGSGLPSVTHAEAVEVALCYGWIDGRARSLDDRLWLQRFTPRAARSRWSKRNRDAAGRLLRAGRMKPSGRREMDRAKADGRWDAAYDSPSTAKVPEDLRRALAENPRAEAAFAALNGTNRYAILHRIEEAKRPQTRSRRIERFVEMLSKGERPYP